MLEGSCHQMLEGGSHQMLEGGCHSEENQRAQMDKDVKDLLATGDEFDNQQSLVQLLCSLFHAKQSHAHNQ